MVHAQTAAKLPNVMTDTLTVSGVCGMCKDRIEEAVMYTSGVKFAEWSADAQQLRVIYKTKKTDQEQICRAIAKAGHDTELAKAADEVYQELPSCCRYRDGVEGH